MSDRYLMFFQETSLVTPNAISLPALASGHTPSAFPAGTTVDHVGLAPALVSLSARQAKEAGLLTSGTSGRTSTISSDAADLRSCLESRFRARMDSAGGTLYRLTWKRRTTPHGQSILAQRASVRRSSGSDCTGWPAPTKGHGDGGHLFPAGASATGIRADGTKAQVTLAGVAQFSGWTSPQKHDAQGAGSADRLERHGTKHGCRNLQDEIHLAGWACPAARDWKDGRASQETMDRNSRPLNEQAVQLTGPVRRLASGEILTGSFAGMESGGQLRPEHSRYLMGLPPEWDDSGVTAMQSTPKRRRRSSRP